ncbi:MAG: hypothetical protein ABF306_13305 [Nocardioides marinisabuli]|uniref:hypothetical protein n=1 Tax=Nocardioides marinisabuli TaxID=419476 RepID=UPI00321AE4D5
MAPRTWFSRDPAGSNEPVRRRGVLAAAVATADLDAVLAAEAVLVVLSEHDGRGMYVELGAALARAAAGELEHVAVVGPVRHQSVFLHHPTVTRWVSAEAWLASLDRARGCLGG